MNIQLFHFAVAKVEATAEQQNLASEPEAKGQLSPTTCACSFHLGICERPDNCAVVRSQFVDENSQVIIIHIG